MEKSRHWQLCGLELYTPLYSYNFDKSSRGWYQQGLMQLVTKKWNWYTFQLFDCTWEYEPYGPLFSWRFNILGFGWYIGFNPPWETKASKELAERYDDAKNSKYFYKYVKVKNPKYKKGKHGK